MKTVAPILVLLAMAGCAGYSPEYAYSDAEPAHQSVEPAQGGGDRYVIDPAASTFTAQVGATGVLSMFGHDHTIAIREYSGEVRRPPDAPEKSSLRITIEAGSLAEVGKGFSDDDRKAIDRDIHGKALQVSQHPKIEFRSTSVSATGEDRIDVHGVLTLHGVSKEVTIPTRVTLTGDTLTAHGAFSVRHSDFKIERLSAAGGTIKAEDKIRLTFTLVARRM
jgi:polyisoprenoid-binding protein YceI